MVDIGLWIIFGWIVGWIVDQIYYQADREVAVSVTAGVFGGLSGGTLGYIFIGNSTMFSIESLFTAIAGAVITSLMFKSITMRVVHN